MSTLFPTSLDNLDPTRGTTGQTLASPNHITHHQNEDDAIEALQTKVGVDNSAVTTSLDYLMKSASSTDPGHKHPASKIVNTPAGTIAATTVQAAIDELDSEKAPKASPTFTGTLTASGTIELGNASDTTLSRSSAGVLAVEGVVIPSISSTNTLTNKRVTLRTGTTASSATPTINTDDVDEYYITAQAVDITSFTTNLSGTPTLGQKLFISVIGTAARAITWGASFANGPVALPTTTVTTTQLSVLLKWDGSIWRCYASGSTV